MIAKRNLRRFASEFSRAMGYAARIHATQLRKETRIPYLSHLLAVASLVLENGGGKDEAIAALLHDAAEDCGGRKRLADIRRRFGPKVAAIVAGCTDTYEDPKPPWKPRKEAYVGARPKHALGATRLGSRQKPCTTRCVLADYRASGRQALEAVQRRKRISCSEATTHGRDGALKRSPARLHWFKRNSTESSPGSSD